MKIEINKSQRYAKMRAHSATHLLHAQLNKIFPNTQQAGSLVDEDYLRFDFKANRLLNNEELQQIENEINKIIYKAIPVEIFETDFTTATEKLGAKAFFQDKYGEIVRVVKIGEESIELCGGTHVNNTKEIGAFKIIGQEPVASGIKRIIAVTGPKTIEYFQKLENLINKLSQKLQVTPKQFEEKFGKTLKELEKYKKENEELKQKLINVNYKEKLNTSKGNEIFDKIILEEDEKLNLKTLIPLLDKISGNILLYKKNGQFMIYSSEGKAKQIAQKLELKGGGNDKIFQGKDEKILNFTK